MRIDKQGTLKDLEYIELYFIHKDFLGFPLNIISGTYKDEGDHFRLTGFTSKGVDPPKRINKEKKHGIRFFTSLEEILEFRICSCSKRNCEYNEELWRIVNNKLENEPRKSN